MICFKELQIPGIFRVVGETFERTWGSKELMMDLSHE
jgi:hypothetical protein